MYLCIIDLFPNMQIYEWIYNVKSKFVDAN